MSTVEKMPLTRILLVHSTMDAITEDRIDIVQRRASALNLDVEHIWIFKQVDFSGEHSPTPSQWIIHNETDIFDRLSDRIDYILPQYLLLHSGVAFLVAPNAVLNIISKLKKRHPALVFGIEQSRTLEMVIKEAPPSLNERIKKLFDQSLQTQRLLTELLG